MEATSLGFSYQMEGLDRDAVLSDAAHRLQVFYGHQSGHAAVATGDSPLANLVRELKSDAAEFAKSPVILKLSPQDIASGSFRPEQGCALYCMQFPVYLHAKVGGGFNRIEAIIEFNPDAAVGTRRPKAVRILPDRRFQTQLKGQMHLEFGLDENVDFTAKSPAPAAESGLAAASVTAKVAAGAHFIAGPFVYDVKRPQIEHSAIGLEKVFWRIDGTEFFQAEDFPLVVVLQVPEEIKELKIAAVMQASRFFSFFTADLQRAVLEFGERLRNYFKAGAPIEDRQIWDVSARL